MLRLVLTLADEPTGELYSASGQRILVLFRQIVEQEQTTILVATHDLMVDAFADEVCFAGRPYRQQRILAAVACRLSQA